MWRKKYHKLQIKFMFSSKIVLKIIPALLNMFIAFNFFVPTLLGIVFLVKVGSSTLLAELFFQQAFYPIYIACLFTWLLYVHTDCLPIASLNQSKQSSLLYLGDV